MTKPVATKRPRLLRLFKNWLVSSELALRYFVRHTAPSRDQIFHSMVVAITLSSLIHWGCGDSDPADVVSEDSWGAIPGALAECQALSLSQELLLIAGGREGFFSYRFGDAELTPCGLRNPEWDQAQPGYGARSAVKCGDRVYFGVAVWDTTDRPVYSSSLPANGDTWALTPELGPVGNSMKIVESCAGEVTSFSTIECAYRVAECQSNWQALNLCQLFSDLDATRVQCETWLFGRTATFAPFVARLPAREDPVGPVTSVFPMSIDHEIDNLGSLVTGAGQLLTGENDRSILFMLEGVTSGLYQWSQGDDHVELLRTANRGNRLMVSPRERTAIFLADSLYVWQSDLRSPEAVSLPDSGIPVVAGIDWPAGVVVIGLRSPIDQRVRLYSRLFPAVKETAT